MFHRAGWLRPDEIQPVEIVGLALAIRNANAFGDTSAEKGCSAPVQSAASLYSVAKNRISTGPIANPICEDDPGTVANPGTTHGPAAAGQIDADSGATESDTISNAFRRDDSGPSADSGPAASGVAIEINADGRSNQNDILFRSRSAAADSRLGNDSAARCGHAATRAGKADADARAAAGR